MHVYKIKCAVLQVKGKEMNSIPDQKYKKNIVFIPDADLKCEKDAYTYKHSGDFGDLIYSLPVVRYYGGGKLLLNPYGLPSKKPDGSYSGFSPATIKLIKPLLEAQPYISKVKHWDRKKVDVDIDYFRTNAPEYENLCHKILGALKVPLTEAEKPWITCEKKEVAPVVIARSFRYRQDLVDYKLIFKDFKECVFVGLEDEHADFESRFGKINYYPVKNLLELAEVIHGSELFVGNQSFPLSLAVGLHHPFLQEYYPLYHDCIFDRKNAHYIYLKRNATNKRS